MSSTHTSLHYHLIFATKNRAPFIAREWATALHEYIGGIVRGLDGHSQGVGGVCDHVHLLISLKPTHCISHFMRELKKNSCAWAREKDPFFQWQEGYAAFSVSASMRDTVHRYIAAQEEHHRKKTFLEELVEFFQKSQVPYDGRYLD